MSKNQIVLCILFCFTLPLFAAEGDSWNDNSPDSQPLFSSDEKPIVTVPIHGNNSFGYYFVNLYFGTPAQQRSMLIYIYAPDTLIPCKGCGSNCGPNHPHELYDPKKSQTDSEMVPGGQYGNYICPNKGKDQCAFDFFTDDGRGIRGNYRQDFISFENYTLPENQKLRRPQRILEEEKNDAFARAFTSFGCILDERGEFFDLKVDGMIGLGWGTNDREKRQQPPNIIDSLETKGFEKAFSLCVGSQGGYMTIGGYNTTYHETAEKPQYLLFDKSENGIGIYWRNISFNGRNIGLAKSDLNPAYGGGAVFNPAADVLTTKPVIYEKIVAAVLNFCSGKVNCGKYEREEGNCWYYDQKIYPDIKDFFATFGTFKFDFGENEDDGVTYEWKPEDYLVRKNDSYCLGIEKIEEIEKSGDNWLTTLGATFMRNHDILFDTTNSRIGFVRANCSAEYSLGNERPVNDGNKSTVNEKQDYFWVKLGIFGVVLVIVIWFLLSLRKKEPGIKFGGVELQDGQKKNYAELEEQEESDSPDKTVEDK